MSGFELNNQKGQVSYFTARSFYGNSYAKLVSHTKNKRIGRAFRLSIAIEKCESCGKKEHFHSKTYKRAEN